MKSYIYRLLLPLVAALLLQACHDELRLPEEPESGLPATVTVTVGPTERVSMSRSDIAEGLDNRVSSLWVGVYNARTGKRTGQATHPDISQNVPDHDLSYSVTVEATSGPCYIVAVANYASRPGFASDDDKDGSIQKALEEKADTWAKFKEISASFDTKGSLNVDAPVNPLIMSGYYVDKGDSDHDINSRPVPGEVYIAAGENKLDGAIHLQRLSSQVKFNVSYNTDNISEFTIRNWQVFNAPVSSWLIERDDADAMRNCSDFRTVNGVGFANSLVHTEVSSDGSTSSFDFWMLESRRTGLPVPDSLAARPYAWRELEFKNPDGSNSGLYRSLVGSLTDTGNPNNKATYVRINVSMTMKRDEKGNALPSGHERRVDATYVVHLGYCEGATAAARATDFNTRRNCRYVYNMTVNNVSDMILEVDNLDERNPANEGIITDITDSRFIRLDAHYNVMNVEFTKDDLADFQYVIQAYNLDGNIVEINSLHPESVPGASDADFPYLKWIEFRKTTGKDVIADYKPHGRSGTYYLSEMNSANEAGWYTMFINEYVYETAADGNESGSTAWHGYVNRPDRRLWLNVTGVSSSDGETKHFVTKYAISQRSIQTFYDSGRVTAIGVEHDNESLGMNLRTNYSPYANNGSHHVGRYNLAWALAHGNSTTSCTVRSGTTYGARIARWSTFLDPNAFQSINDISATDLGARTVQLPRILPGTQADRGGTRSFTSKYDPDQSSSPIYVEAIRACLNRNRDLDGDGYIDAEELRWFVPTVSQYEEIVLGRQSLETPLVNLTGMTRLLYEVNDYCGRMLFYGSDGTVLWSMEGTSVSQWGQWGADSPAPAWHVRCVRNLGTNMTSISANEGHHVVDIPYEHDAANRIIRLSGFDSKSIRVEPFLSAGDPMPVHHIYDSRYNRCYKAFEYAPSLVSTGTIDSQGFSSIKGTWNYDIAGYLSGANPCKSLETSTGRTGWRVPNQKELSMLCDAGVAGNGNGNDYTYILSCSMSCFDKKGYAPGCNPSDPTSGGSLTSMYRYTMKAVNATENMTQGGDDTNSFYVRCVRDYIE